MEPKNSSSFVTNREFIARNSKVFQPKGNRALNCPLPYMNYNVDNLGYPPTTPLQSPPFHHHYPENRETLPGPVERLIFHHVGNLDAAPVFPDHHRTCTSIQFSGHISSTNAVFDILSQLPMVETVIIVIGPSQQHYFPEAYKTVPGCPFVKNLKIEMDLTNFYSFRHYDCSSSSNSSQCDADNYMSTMQYSLIHLVETLLIHAKCSFPNLKNLEMNLIESDRLNKALESLIESCDGVRLKIQTKLKEVSSADGSNEVTTMSFNGAGRNWTGNRFQARLDTPSVLGHKGQAHSRNYAYPKQFQTNNSSSTSQAQCSRTDGSDVPQFLRPQHNRPPPGFSPLPIMTRQGNSGHVTGINTINSQNEQSVNQRVINWLSSVQNAA